MRTIKTFLRSRLNQVQRVIRPPSGVIESLPGCLVSPFETSQWRMVMIKSFSWGSCESLRSWGQEIFARPCSFHERLCGSAYCSSTRFCSPLFLDRRGDSSYCEKTSWTKIHPISLLPIIARSMLAVLSRSVNYFCFLGLILRPVVVSFLCRSGMRFNLQARHARKRTPRLLQIVRLDLIRIPKCGLGPVVRGHPWTICPYWRWKRMRVFIFSTKEILFCHFVAFASLHPII